MSDRHKSIISGGLLCCKNHWVSANTQARFAFARLIASAQSLNCFSSWYRRIEAGSWITARARHSRRKRKSSRDFGSGPGNRSPLVRLKRSSLTCAASFKTTMSSISCCFIGPITREPNGAFGSGVSIKCMRPTCR